MSEFFKMVPMSDQRLLILRESPSVSLRSWALTDVGNLIRTSRPNGTGSVYFTEEWRRGSKGRRYSQQIGFLGICDPKRLEETIRNLSAAPE